MEWIETLIGAVLVFGCGLGIIWFGHWAGNRNDKPMGFWANGKPLDPQKVTDIPAYNRALGKLFQYYGYPCMLSGGILAFSPLDGMFAYISLAILVAWGILGTWWLIHSYKQIENSTFRELCLTKWFNFVRISTLTQRWEEVIGSFSARELPGGARQWENPTKYLPEWPA